MPSRRTRAREPCSGWPRRNGRGRRRPPDEVLSGTNHLLIDLDPGQFATCCYVRLDPPTGRAMVARAGHPPPLLRRPGGRTPVLDIPGGVVLGVDPLAHYPVTEVVMDPGAVLALYTDGLVERAGDDIDEGISAPTGSRRPPGTPRTDPTTSPCSSRPAGPASGAESRAGAVAPDRRGGAGRERRRRTGGAGGAPSRRPGEAAQWPCPRAPSHGTSGSPHGVTSLASSGSGV